VETAAPVDIVRRFSSQVDPKIRRNMVFRTVKELGPLELCNLLGYLCYSMPNIELAPIWLDVVLAALACIDEAPDRFQASYQHLSNHPRQMALSFLIGTDDACSAITGSEPVIYDYEDVPLGVRKTRARGQNRSQLDVLRNDPAPSVIHILLENPRLVETDVLRIAAKRPQSAKTFYELVSSSRFGLRRPLISAISMNPFTPIRLAIALVPMLPKGILKEVVTLTALDESIRQAANAFLT
jgi:hypothetical protein